MDFPGTVPFLELLFSHDGRFHRLMGLVPDKFLDPVAFRETIDKLISVFVDPPCEIRRHTNIERPISLAGKNINARLLSMWHLTSCQWFPWMPDQAGHDDRLEFLVDINPGILSAIKFIVIHALVIQIFNMPSFPRRRESRRPVPPVPNPSWK
jgi:hypothetical protein